MIDLIHKNVYNSTYNNQSYKQTNTPTDNGAFRKGLIMAAATNTKTIAKINEERAISAEHIAFLVSNEYDELSTILEPLPDLIQLLIDNYHLDSLELTRGQAIDLGNAHKILFSTLKVVQDALWNYQDKASAIDYRQIVKAAEL